MINPLTRCVEDYSLPPYAELQVSDIVPAVRTAIDELALDLNSIEDDLSCPDAEITWTSVMDRLEIIDNPLNRLSCIITHLSSVCNSQGIRDAEREVLAEVSAILSRRMQSQEIYQAMKTLRDSSEWGTLTREQKRLLDRSILGAQLQGVELVGDAKVRFNEHQVQLKELKHTYSNNILDAVKNYSRIVHVKEELVGVSASTLTLLAQNAVSGGYPTATAMEGPWKLTLDTSASSAILKSCSNRTLREELYRASNGRASVAPYDNGLVVDEILRRRHDCARLLGYESYAEFSLADKMAPSVELVQDMLNELRDRSMEISKDELEKLQEFATEHGQHERIEVWDLAYWKEQMRKELFELDESAIQEYFPLARVLAGLFELTFRLFGIHIEAVSCAGKTWHPHVLFFQMRAMEREDKPIISQFYIDPFARPGEKQHGSWVSVLESRSKVLQTEEYPIRLPLFSLQLNASAPVGDEPSLMTFYEVESLFHNFGHGLRYSLTQAEYTATSRTEGVEWDAIEMPSQMFVNFCYSRGRALQSCPCNHDLGALQLISGHYTTGASLPDDMLAMILKSRKFMAATFLLRQLNYAATDMVLHHEHDPHNSNESIFDVHLRVMEKFCAMPSLYIYDKILCSFNHLFSTSYGAGYYSYVWSEMLSADAYSSFDEANDEEEMKKVGRHFRDTYLSQVGILHPLEAFELFRGRKQSTDALLRQYGLEN